MTRCRGAGRGHRAVASGVAMLAWVWITSATALGQTVSAVSPAYRPGRYVPLRIQAAAAGTVAVTGAGIQPIEWAASGKSTVVVPLLVFGDSDRGSPLDVRVNGRPASIDVRPLGPGDADPPDLAAFWTTVDPRPPVGAVVDDDAHALAGLWRPGPSAATARWTRVALAVVVLSLGVAVHADPKRRTVWLLVAAGGLSAGAVAWWPAESPRRVLPADGRPGWEWVWRAGVAGGEPWSPGLRSVPRSAVDAAAVEPVLACDATGRPVSIRWTATDVGSTRDVRVVLMRPRRLPH